MSVIVIIDCGSSKTFRIDEMVYEFCDTRVVQLADFHISDHDDAIGFVVSGAPILITEVDTSPYLKQLDWIKNSTRPVLGICFGHQLIGLLHGALSSRMKEDRDWQTIEILVDCPLFDRLPNEIQMMEDHCEAISIPENFTHVAVSDACVNEAMMHKEKPFYGVQFHPEVSGNHGAVLFENFVNICLNQGAVPFE